MRKDIDISFSKHPLTGDLTVKTESAARKQALKNLIMTNFYERGFNLDPASSVTSYLFEQMSNTDVLSLKSRIIEVVEVFEPEVEINEVVVRKDRYDLVVDIYYFEVNNSEEQIYSLSLG